MTPESPIDPRQALEASLTALLLGELPPDQAAFLQRAMAVDPELAKKYERIQQTIELVRETERTPAAPAGVEPAALKLSEERRQALLQRFKTVSPPQFAKKPERRVSWLIPVAAAVVLTAMLAAMMLPALSKAKSKSQMASTRAAARFAPGDRDSLAAAGHNVPGEQARSLFEQRKMFSGRTVSTGGAGLPEPSAAAPPPPPGPTRAPSRGVIVLPSGGVSAGQSTVVTPTPPDSTSTVTLKLNVETPAYGGYALSELKTDSDKPLMFGTKLENGVPADGRANAPGFNWGGGGFGVARPAAPTAAANPVAGDQTFTFNRVKLPEASPGQGLLAWTGGAGGGGVGGGILGGAMLPATAPESTFERKWSLDGASRLAEIEQANRRDDDLSAAGTAESALRRRYGLSRAESGQKVKGLGEGKLSARTRIDPATGLPAGAVAGLEPPATVAGAIDPVTGLPAGTVEAIDPTTGLPVAGRQRELRDQLQAADALKPSSNVHSLNVVGYVNVPLQGSNWAVNSEIRGFYNDEEQRRQDAKETNGKQLPGVFLPQVEPQKEPAAAKNVVLAQALPLTQQSDATEAAKREQVKPLQPPVTDEAKKRVEELGRLGKESAAAQTDGALPRSPIPPPIPQPEIQTRDNAFSTFSLNVSDVSFKLAAASLEKGVLPDPASIRSEEFINGFDYRDPEASAGTPIAFAWERARYPFAQNRDLLRFSLKTAAQGRQAGRALNLVLLLDNSGSMERADRVRIIREALRVLATQLQPQDTFSVVTFARTARLWVDGVPGSQAGQVGEELSTLTPQGGTNLGDALDLAYQTALRHYLANGINRVVLLTDGAANLGNVEPDSLKAKVEANRRQGIALDCFGIGWEGYNDDLLEVLTRHGDGRYGFINSPEEAASGFAGQLAGALRVAASDVKVQVEFNPQRVTAYRQLGYAKHQLTKEQFRDNTVDAAEIGAAESGNALYVLETNPTGAGPLATVRVRYKVPGTTDYREREWAVPYTGNAAPLEQSSAAMRLAATAGAFSEWLATSPFAAEATPDALLGYLNGVPEVYGADQRPKTLEWMLRQAKSVSGTK